MNRTLQSTEDKSTGFIRELGLLDSTGGFIQGIWAASLVLPRPVILEVLLIYQTVKTWPGLRLCLQGFQFISSGVVLRLPETSFSGS